MSKLSYIEQILSSSSTFHEWENAIRGLDIQNSLSKDKRVKLYYNSRNYTLKFKNMEHGEIGEISLNLKKATTEGVVIDIETKSKVVDATLMDSIKIRYADNAINITIAVGEMLARIEHVSIQHYREEFEVEDARISTAACGTFTLRVLLKMILGKVFFDDYRYSLIS